MGDRFYLCENKILCEYDYEERLVFANMAYNPSSLAHIRRQVGNLQVGPRPHPSLSLSRTHCSFYFVVYTLIENARSQENLLWFFCQFVLNRVFLLTFMFNFTVWYVNGRILTCRNLFSLVLGLNYQSIYWSMILVFQYWWFWNYLLSYVHSKSKVIYFTCTFLFLQLTERS